jgi:hypothetical protein
MSLDIKELYKSDLDPIDISLWWSTKKVEKLNWNFDRIKESGGGPLGPQGWHGKTGLLGTDGSQGTIGRQGPTGLRGNQGFSGETSWIENPAHIGDTNSTILIKQVKDDPSSAHVGYTNTSPEYSLVPPHNSARGAINRFNTVNSSRWNAVFTSSNIDGSNTNLSTRKSYYWNLYVDDFTTHSTFESGFHNTIGGKTVFNSNKFLLQTPIFTNSGGTIINTPSTNIKYYLTLDSAKFELDPSVISVFDNTATFAATTLSGTPINHKFGPNYYSASILPGQVAYTDSPAPNGTVMWGNAYDVIGGFPIGTIIAIDDQFTSDFFYLEETAGVITNKAAVSGFDNPSITPAIEFKYGAGKPGTKFEGWYLCNGKSWYKGTISYDLPDLCGFDYDVSYDIFGDLLMGSITAVGNINHLNTNRQVLGSAVIGFKATEVYGGAYAFSNGNPGYTNVIESYIDNGEPLEHIYEGSGTTTLDYQNGTAATDAGLIYLCYLGADGYRWNTDVSAPALNPISLSYNLTNVTSACGAIANSYQCNFLTQWNDSGTWTSNGNKLYNSAGTAYASSGYYHDNGIVRYWNSSTGTFTARTTCPSYTSIVLAYNAAVNSTGTSGLNGTWASRSTSTYYADSSSLSLASVLYTDSAGTTLATDGWYRGAGSRRYWDGTTFVGAVLTADYVNYLSTLSYDSTASGACDENYFTYAYYENSVATSKTFTGTTAIAYLFTSYNGSGTSNLDYANSAYYYSDSSYSRKCNNSYTGALSSAASCSVSPTPPSGGGGGGGGCVLFGTKIKMIDGTFKHVQDISVGDVLYSKSVDTMPIKEELNNLYDWSSSSIKLTDETVRVVSNRSLSVTEVYSINDGKLFTSWDHNHLCKHNGIWKISKTVDLQAGDSLIDENGKEIIINNIVVMTGQFIVYKLDVEENDLYIANGVLTHNLKQEVQFGLN